MALTSSSDIKEHLNDIFDRLCSPEAHISSDGEDKLQKFIDSSKKTPLTCDGNAGYTHSSDWLEILETKISEFMSAKPYNPNKQKGSLRALDLLMENQIRLHHYTRHLGTITSIRPSTDLDLQEHAACTLGKLHQASGNKYTQSVEYEIRVFFEFLNHYEDETQMLQAVLMLKQIATAMPTLFIAKATSDHFFNRLLPAFRSNPGTRERGAQLLNVVSRIFASREISDQRETDIRNTWAFNVYKCSKQLSENLSNESDCHGAILMLTELVSVATDKKYQRGTTLLDYNTGNFEPLRKVSLNTLPVDKFDAALDGNNIKLDLPKDVVSLFARKVILTNYFEICTQVLSIMLQSSSYKDSYTRHSLVCLIPKLAAVDPGAFERHNVNAPISSHPGFRKIFHESITYLIENQPWKMPHTDKRLPANVSIDPELQSLAMLAKIMGERIKAHKDRLIMYIYQIFNPEPMSVKRGARPPQVQVPASAYALVAYLVQALKFSLDQGQMDTLLGSVMKSGLNRQLAICFHDICSAGAPDKLKLELRDKLIKELTLKIVEFEAKQSTDESLGNLQSQKSRKNSSFSQATPPILDAKDESSVVIIMALEILAAFDFTGISLSRTVNFCAQRLLVHDKAIRLAACRACCNLIISDDANFLLDSNRAKTARAEAEHTLKSVLPKIINLGVTDPSKSVREAIVSSLDSRFDRYLVQADNLNALFIGLYDECFKVRQYVVCILGRLSEANAAYVLPALRKLLLQLLKEFDYTRDSIVRENCSVLLGNLIYSTPRLLSPYLESLMNSIIPKLIAVPSEPNVAIAIMRTIGILAEVSGREIGAYLAKLLPKILEFIKDTQSAKKRVVGLWTLSNLIFSSGRVVQPCIDYPELMDILLDLVKTEVSIPVRREVIKLLGSLGPLDPYTYKTILQPMLLQNLRQAEKEVENTDPNLAEMTSMIESSVMDEVYPAVATDALLKILSDPTQAQYWPRVVESFRFMIVSMGIKSVSFIWRVIPAYLSVLRQPSVSTDQNQMSEIILYNLSKIVNTVKEHIRPYLKDIVECLNDIWNPSCECDIIELLSHLARFVGTDLKLYFHILLPRVVEILRSDHRVNNPAVYKLIQSFQSYGVMLEGFMYMILPPMMRCLESFHQPDIKKIICETLIFLCEKIDMGDFSSLMVHSLLRVVEADQHVARLSMQPGSSQTNLSQMAAANGAEKQITNKVFDVLAAICFTLKSRFHIFRPIVDQIAKKYNINHLNYQFVLDNIDHMFHAQTGKYRSDIGARIFKRRTLPSNAAAAEAGGIERHNIEGDIPHLKRAWCTEGKFSKEDWINWFKNLSSTLLSRSPSPILRGCSQLDHPQLRRDLFNVAFLSCWVELDQLNQNELSGELEVALQVDNVPELTLAILNLAEFMEHSEKGPLPLDHLLLGKQALKSGAYAKALYYRESALVNHDPSSEEVPKILESLIQVNTKLQNYEAATGVLRLATKKKNFRVDESWYESLGQWENALQQYNLRVGQFLDPKHYVGKMRCLDGLAEWEDLHGLVKGKWGQDGYKKDGMEETVAELALRACWALGNWAEMPTYIAALPEKSFKQNYYKAACALHEKDTYNAVRLIQDCRDLVDNELTTLVKESYNRAYQTLVLVKHLSEMEEVITYNYLRNRQESIKQMWRDRLLGGQPNVQDWLLSIHVHSLALRPEENEATMLKFASLCMRQNKMKLSFNIIQSLLPEIQLPDSAKLKDITDQQNLDREVGDMTERLADACSSKISVVYIYMKQLWEVHQRHDAVKQSLIKSLGYISQKVSSLYSTASFLGGDPSSGMSMRRQDRVKQVARFCLLYASWQISLFGISTRSVGEIVHHCQVASEADKQWYKAWRMLAETSAEASKLLRNNPNPHPMHSSLNSSALSIPGAPTFASVGGGGSSMFGTQRSNSSSTGRNNALSSSQQSFIAGGGGDQVKMYFLQAINAFVKSIKCCWDTNKDTLQDTLRLLTLLFENASLIDNAEMVLDTLKQVHVDIWLQVIPQLIARVGSARTVIGKIILPLLIDIGKAHPHAAVYSLMVGAKSSSLSRSQAIQTVLDSMKDRYPDLIKQAQILSHELIRVSILWHEMWHEGLEEASKQYFADRNPRGMFAILEPLHELIEKGPETLKENSFMQHFGRDLMEAKECCNRYQQHGNSRELSQAWDLYYQVFRNITKQNQSMTSLELNYVSPKLLNCCRDLDLAVPGTYKPNQSVIRIQAVNPVVSVIQSKQKPRKLCISGNNGKDYQFLLKGHEDMRQDERVLQLFGLVNSLLANDKHNLKRNLGAIPQYAVIPLSTNSGLCGWVPHCDPLHTLIKEYRDKTKTQLNLEHRLMLRLANDYDHLTKMQKVEVFESALNATNGLDLAKIMWYRSANSEIWYERRLTYTRSLAVMSMVGYILGLGDRHPSNIMLERLTGNIIHIDFGDCFEVAVHREKFPEKIPFRLTRMLIKAMEVNGIEGNYRISCETTMRLLRQNKDSLLAVLEAFVNDPLLNWLALDVRSSAQNAAAAVAMAGGVTHGINSSAHHLAGGGATGGGGGVYPPQRVNNGGGNASMMTNPAAMQQNGGTNSRSSIRLNPGTGSGGGGGGDDAMSGLQQPQQQPEGNRKALDVLKRVSDKLNGEDFGGAGAGKLDVQAQVAKLIDQATSHENLCQSYIGWCPFW